MGSWEDIGQTTNLVIREGQDCVGTDSRVLVSSHSAAGDQRCARGKMKVDVMSMVLYTGRDLTRPKV